MIYHHTKNKGDLGVLKVKVDLFEQGFLILIPETEHSPFDLVIYKEGVFKTVQVNKKSGQSTLVFDPEGCELAVFIIAMGRYAGVDLLIESIDNRVIWLFWDVKFLSWQRLGGFFHKS